MPLARDPNTVGALSVPGGIAVGLATVAALTVLKLAAADSIGWPTPYLLYFGAALVAAWIGGTFAGLVTTGVAAGVGYAFFVAPLHGESSNAIVGGAVFLLEGALITALTAQLRRAAIAAAAATATTSTALEQVRAVVEGVGSGVTMQDDTGALVFANEEAARIAGFASPREMIAGWPHAFAERHELFGEDGTPLPLEQIPSRAVLRGEAPREVLARMRDRATGEERWTMIRANGVRDGSGAIRRVVTVFRDVTHEHAQDQALRVSREWLTVALRSIGDAVVTTDATGRVTFVNPVAEALTGWKAADASGKPLDDVFAIFDEATHAPVESPVARVLREGLVVGLANHTVLRSRDGTERSIDDSAAPIRLGGRTVGVVLVFRDVTAVRRNDQRKAFLMRATAELNSSLEYETTLATVARLAVPAIADWCAVDMQHEPGSPPRRLAVAHVDPAKVQLVSEIERRHPADWSATTGAAQVLRTGEPYMMASIPPALVDAAAVDDEHRSMLRQLELRSYIAVPIKHGERVLGVISLAMAESRRTYDEADLAFASALGERAAVAIENSMLYREAQRFRQSAEAANRAKDEFLAMLGHELRNPLAPIVTALHLMEQGESPPFARERAVIKRQLEHVVRLVDDLLDVARITRGQIDLAKEIVDVRGIVDRAIEMSSPLIEQKRHQLTVEAPEGLRVSGDPTRLAQVLANLIQNAAKYTEPGGHVAIRAAREGGEVVLRVRDDGVGIAPETLPRIFDLFTQERQSLARSRGGLGLGLAIVKTLVEMHGGRVEAHSEGEGRGSELVVRLPLVEAELADAAELRRPAVPDVGRTRILCVDDNEDALEMLTMALELDGYEVVTATDAPSALDAARRTRPSIALLDIGLPVIDGYELARSFRADPELASMHLLALTGYGQASDRQRSLEAGFDEHLTKPISLDALRAAIARTGSDGSRTALSPPRPAPPARA